MSLTKVQNRTLEVHGQTGSISDDLSVGRSLRMHIKQIQPGDFDLWRPLWQGFLDHDKASLSEETTRLTFERMADPSHTSMEGLLALDGSGAGLGMVTIIFHPSTFQKNDRCYLEDLFVSPAARGQGVGRALIDGVCDLARERKADKVYWQTYATNETARRLYDTMAEQSHLIYQIKLNS
ncbi:MAG: GNAT family N-acetyltransferase [Pseudomonadota bacterium]